MKHSLDSFAKLISRNVNIEEHFINYNGRILRFQFKEEELAPLETAINDFSISAAIYGNECELELDKKYNDLVIFFDEQDFLTRISQFKNAFNESCFLILKFGGSYILKEDNEQFSVQKALIFNILPYQDLISLFAANTDFVTLHDSIKHQLIIFSGEKGPFYIGYNMLEEKVKNLPNIQQEMKKTEDYLSRIDFTQFFKEAVINGIHREPEQNRFYTMIKSIDVLLELASRDHRIYLKKFGFDKIKAKFKEERVKYFDNIEKSIDAVSKQVTSFPLTFSASVFAGYQVKNNPVILILVLAAYGLYTLIAWKILNITAFNHSSISVDVDAEAYRIENEYNVLFDEFKSDFEKIRNKLNKLKGLINILKAVLIGLLAAFFIFYIYETFTAKTPTAPTEVKIIK